jgi:putative hydrolase of the HAD superfamily
MFVSVAEGLGINGLLHENYATTREKLAAFGFTLPDQ